MDLFGQNLVPNGSFERLRDLPVKPNPKNSFEYEPLSGYKPFQHNLNFWFAGTLTTPDLRIKSNKHLGLCGKRFDDCDEPKTGSNCVGIITFMENRDTKTYREYIQIKLKSNLKKGVKTYVELWVRKERQAKLVSNNIGCYFSEKKIVAGETEVISVNPQVNHSTLLNEKESKWIKIKDEFIPDKEFHFLSIGNFFKNTETEVAAYSEYSGSPYTPPYAYYLIDDVRVWQEGSVEEEIALKFEEKEVTVNEAVVLENIEFNHDSWELKNDTKDNLQSLLDFMKENRKVNILIMGHTDNSGNQIYNQKLSENRSKTVMEYLISNGVPHSRLRYKGFGDNHPLVENTNEVNKQKNRRVEFMILEK